LRWRLGIYVGYAASSNEYDLALPNGNVVKSRSIVRVVPSGRWDQKSLFAVQGIPGKLTVSDEPDDVDIEAFPNPHENLDDAERDARDSEAVDSRAMDSSRIGGDEGMKVMDRQIRLTRADLRKYGYTSHCPRCLDIEAGAYGTRAHHSDECRLRIYLSYYENNDKKWRDVESQVSKEVKPAGDKEEIRLEGLEKSGTEAMEQPKARDTPLSPTDHFSLTNESLKGCKFLAIQMADPARLSHMVARMSMMPLMFSWTSKRMTTIWVTPQQRRQPWKPLALPQALIEMQPNSLSTRSSAVPARRPSWKCMVKARLYLRPVEPGDLSIAKVSEPSTSGQTSQMVAYGISIGLKIGSWRAR
jgi:hypothetical protein